MTSPFVSAIMPAYNAEAFLEPALESLLAQDYERFEVIVVDDGSVDRTPEILRSYPTVRTIRQENAGPGPARNTAIAASRGEFVAAFDADDLWPANRIRLQAEYMMEHPEVGCVLGRQEWMNPPPWLTRDEVYGDLDGIPVCAALYRRSILDAIGGFDTGFFQGEDMDLLIRMRERGVGVAVLPELVLYRRFHGSNVTASRPEVNPLLRSLRGRLERGRAAGATASGGTS